MDKKESSKTVHSELSERDPLFEAAARKFIADGYVTISMFMFDNGIQANCRATRGGRYRRAKPRTQTP